MSKLIFIWAMIITLVSIIGIMTISIYFNDSTILYYLGVPALMGVFVGVGLGLVEFELID
jgi:hypothetical protein